MVIFSLFFCTVSLTFSEKIVFFAFFSKYVSIFQSPDFFFQKHRNDLTQIEVQKLPTHTNVKNNPHCDCRTKIRRKSDPNDVISCQLALFFTIVRKLIYSFKWKRSNLNIKKKKIDICKKKPFWINCIRTIWDSKTGHAIFFKSLSARLRKR